MGVRVRIQSVQGRARTRMWNKSDRNAKCETRNSNTQENPGGFYHESRTPYNGVRTGGKRGRKQKKRKTLVFRTTRLLCTLSSMFTLCFFLLLLFSSRVFTSWLLCFDVRDVVTRPTKRPLIMFRVVRDGVPAIYELHNIQRVLYLFRGLHTRFGDICQPFVSYDRSFSPESSARTNNMRFLPTKTQATCLVCQTLSLFVSLFLTSSHVLLFT